MGISKKEYEARCARVKADYEDFIKDLKAGLDEATKSDSERKIMVSHSDYSEHRLNTIWVTGKPELQLKIDFSARADIDWVEGARRSVPTGQVDVTIDRYGTYAKRFPARKAGIPVAAIVTYVVEALKLQRLGKEIYAQREARLDELEALVAATHERFNVDPHFNNTQLRVKTSTAEVELVLRSHAPDRMVQILEAVLALERRWEAQDAVKAS